MLERYKLVSGKKLRCGYTTGTCAMAASIGAIRMLLGGEVVDSVNVCLMDELDISLKLQNPRIEGNVASCGVIKDAGDDIDATNNILIESTISLTEGNDIVIDGGMGIGRVTKEGLDQKVGMAAINSTPRRMIYEGVKRVCEEYGYRGGVRVIISAPEGEKIAKKTFNERIGVVGGISILGTTGIVEPMSENALIDTIEVELKTKKASGAKYILATPGNYGLEYVKGNTSLASELAVKCSNYVGDLLDMAIAYGFEGVLLIGHIGKLVKLGAGILNTHSSVGDGRMESIAACGIVAGVSNEILKQILDCNTTDEAIEILDEYGVRESVMQVLMDRIENTMSNRVKGEIKVAAVVFSNKHGLLGKTSMADIMMNEEGY